MLWTLAVLSLNRSCPAAVPSHADLHVTKAQITAQKKHLIDQSHTEQESLLVKTEHRHEGLHSDAGACAGLDHR